MADDVCAYRRFFTWWASCQAVEAPAGVGVKRVWGFTAIGLGAWEAAAYSTRRCPTISVAVARARVKHEFATRMVLALLVAGLLRHFYTHQP